jgi:phosphoglycerate dehydrogenase-like enzyme
VLALLTDSDRFPFDTDDLGALAGAGVRLRELPGHDPARIVEAGQDVDAVFVYSGKFTAEVIERLPACRVLARCGVGYDNIDVDAAREHGITVTYVPDYGSEDVAEHTLALMFACARRIAASDRAVQHGGWPGYRQLGPMYRMSGRTLGLLGFGRIARCVARGALAFGMRVLAHDPFVDPAACEALGVHPVGRDELLRTADVVSIHLPLTAETRHSVDAGALALMKPTALLLNTSRGAVIDQRALEEAVLAGRIAGAGLDVLETEPPEPDSPLRTAESVLITPHSAAFTEEALAEVRKRALADALRVLRGEAPLDPVPEGR